MQIEPDYDALVVGGSFAGLAAATYIARAKRRVLVVDGGQPRNHFSPAAHGFLGHDGLPPGEILATARGQVLAYPNATLRTGEVVAIQPNASGFDVRLNDGTAISSRKLVMATGLRDELPALPGLSERWGRTVLHCPYCHGYETGGSPLGVLATHPMSAHQANLVHDWGSVTFFTNGAPLPDEETVAKLIARGVVFETAPIAALLGNAPALTGVVLADGRELPLNALFVAPVLHQCPLVTQLRLDMDESPTGPIVRTDERRMTSVPGIYAAGDIVRSGHSVSFAVADGVMAGISLHQALVAEAA
ncbi:MULTISPECIES: NAD(P)/FAD-dependent oxidoreductase [unclassified Pseudoxanthomonas]|uniref:NAD(P)/FAD-dependent oxidoreductase n=1 Tax=unclassified Pseudoxanthomonas TaxID=2645906 RepID=UPI003077D229